MKVLIVDDDKLVCASLRVILEADKEIEVAALGYSGKEAVDLYEGLQPDVLLMDIRMDNVNGIEAGKSILSRHERARILFLTTFLDDEYIIEALHIGAKGYILKQNFESIVPSIKAVFMGQNVFGTEIITKIPALMTENGRHDLTDYGISDKEYNIIEAVANGLSNREIAKSLFLSEGTVRNYLSIVLEKLSLRDRTQLAIFYYKNR